MKRILFVLIGLCLVSMTQAAIFKIAAEDPEFYTIAGANWSTVVDATASSGAYITATVNGTSHNAANDRHYAVPLEADTYYVYLRVYIGSGAANDDSCYVPTDSFGADAAMSDWNSTSGDAIAGESIDEQWGWARLEGSYGDTPRQYTLASAGTAIWKLSPREDGFLFDAIAFVPSTQTVTGTELSNAPFLELYARGAATDPVPSGEIPVDSEITTALSWAGAIDPNLVSITGYDVYFGTDPNTGDNPSSYVAGGSNSLSVSLDYNTPYFWRVDTHLVWDSNEISGGIDGNQTVEGAEWEFVTLPDNKIPAVTPGSDVLTAMELLEASVDGTVNDYGEGDIITITWTAVANAPAVSMQMINRTGATALENLAELTSDPNLLQDWIGTDTRDDAVNKPFGDPMVLTLKGLLPDTYSWTSYHHDPDATMTGMFDVTVIDSTGSTVTADNQIGDSNSLPVGTFNTSFTVIGTDDVVLIFDLQPYVGQGFNDAWFVMNGFELTADTVGGSPLYIDFGNVGIAPMPGYEAYEASHEQAASFTEQSYSAFNTTVSILPTWGGLATMTDTTNNPSSSSQSATLDTDWPGEYIVTLSATDSAMQTDSDTLTVMVAVDACQAAQQSLSWQDFNATDFNDDCVVNLSDFALMASEWLDDRNLTVQE